MANPQSLAELMIDAERYVAHAMDEFGRIVPLLFLIGANGPLLIVGDRLPDVAAKQSFASTVRMVCVARAATACVLALEVWAKFAQPGEKLDLGESPSERIDRREFVVLMGESKTQCRQRFLPIIRSGNGKFFGLGEAEESVSDQLEGRFAHLLPAKTPNAEMRRLANIMLQLRGFQLPDPRAGRRSAG